MNMVMDRGTMDPNISQLYKPSAVATAENLLSKNLKIKMGNGSSPTETGAEPERSSHLHSRGLNCRFSVKNERTSTLASCKERRSVDNKLQRTIVLLDDMVAADTSSVQQILSHAGKPAPVSLLNGQTEQRRESGRSVTQGCATILRNFNDDIAVTDNSTVQLSVNHARKRGPVSMVDAHKEKKRRNHSSLTQQRADFLRRLEDICPGGDDMAVTDKSIEQPHVKYAHKLGSVSILDAQKGKKCRVDGSVKQQRAEFLSKLKDDWSGLVVGDKSTVQHSMHCASKPGPITTLNGHQEKKHRIDCSVVTQQHRASIRKSKDDCSGHADTVLGDISSEHSVVKRASKRGPVKNFGGQKETNWRIDNIVTRQCANILRKLTTDPCGWVFNQPVDPVELNIPDYFDIISNPMDLGTIKSKLQNKLYTYTEEFVEDVRLTFSNAMLYNPPGNEVHMMAKKLRNVFESSWESLEAKWSSESPIVGQDVILKEKVKVADGPHQDYHNATTKNTNFLSRVSMTSAQKQEIRKAPMEVQSALGHNESSCRRNFLKKDLHKGTGNLNGHARGSLNIKSHSNLSAGFKDSSGSMICGRSRQSDFMDASTGLGSKQSFGKDNKRVCHTGERNTGSLVDDTVKRRMSKSDPKSDGEKGATSAMDEDAIHSSARPGTPATTDSFEKVVSWESNAYDTQLSPSKALRAAKLRNRFADTILKAHGKILLDNGEKSDPLKMKQEKERLEKLQREEKARIDSELKAAEAALKMKETGLKMKREREREAARIALQKLEKTVEFSSNIEILKELEKLCGNGVGIMFGSPRGGNILEKFGLFIKDDYMREDEDESWRCGDYEEGEIAR